MPKKTTQATPTTPAKKKRTPARRPMENVTPDMITTDVLAQVKRIRFVNAWMKNGQNGVKAYREAYSCPEMTESVAGACASRLLNHAKVKEYIAKRVADLEINSTATLDMMLNLRLEMVKKSMRDIKVIDNKGNHTGDYTYDSAGAARAIEGIEKFHLGIAEKIGVELSGSIDKITEEDQAILAAHHAAEKEKPALAEDDGENGLDLIG